MTTGHLALLASLLIPVKIDFVDTAALYGLAQNVFFAVLIEILHLNI